jgi:hypothetical protein
MEDPRLMNLLPKHSSIEIPYRRIAFLLEQNGRALNE